VSRFLLRALLRGLLILLVLCVLLLTMLAGLLGSEAGNRWLLQQAERLEPRLQLEFEGGRLWQGWAFSRILWHDQTLRVEVEQAQLNWSPGCLGGRRLCIDLLAAERVQIFTEPDDSEDEPRRDIDLPDIRLPLGIHLHEARLGRLELNGAPAMLQDVQLQAQASGDNLHITRFSGQGMDMAWQLDGDVRMSGDWPLLILADIQLPPIDGRPWALQTRLGGSAANLELESRSSGYLDGQLTAQVQPLRAELPLQARWRGNAFLATQSLPETLTLHDLELDLEGDLDQGIGVAARSRLEGEGGDVDLQLSGQLTTSEFSGVELQLNVADEPARLLHLNGRFGWEDQLSADAELQMLQFPWQWLYPQSLGDLQVNQLNAQAHLRGERIESNLQAGLSGAGGQTADLSLSLSGTARQLDINPLTLTTSGGSLTGAATVGMEEAITWQADLHLDGLNPQLFVSQLPGSLSGPVTSTGRLHNGQLELDADWNIGGTLRRQPLSLQGTVGARDEQWQLRELNLQQGENRISGAGQWGQTVSGALDLQLPALHTLWPGLGGQLAGRIQASGAAASPKISMDIKGQRLAFDAFAMANLDLAGTVTLDEQLPGSLNLTAARLRNGDTRLGDLSLSIDGNKASHHLAADLQGGVLELDARLSGRLGGDAWRGSLASGNIAADDMLWQLQDPASIAYRMHDGDLRLGAHCWAHLDSQLCFSGEQQLLPDRQLNLQLENFPLASLQPWLPEDFDWQGRLDAAARLQQRSGAAPVGTVHLSSHQGEIRVSNPDQELQLPYDTLEFTAELDQRRAETRLQLLSSGLGNLNVQASISDPGGAQTLVGQFMLDNVQLDILRPFLPQVETLSGDLIGNGSLSGTLKEPLVQGQVQLRDGQVSGPDLPVSFEQLQMLVAITGQQASIDGRWNSGAGQGRLAGTAAWAPAMHVDLKLYGENLPIRVAPYADLLTSPDLHIGLQDNNLNITGDIAVPEGEITVRELPPAAVRVSPDAEIVGAEPEMEQDAPLGITANVRLLVGDQLHFSGFGLTGRLSGLLQVRENLTATGDLNILDGRFRGYGQRLELRRAQILFAGPLSKPYLDIEAIRRVDDVIAGLRLTGQAEAPVSEVFSEPAMAQEQALAYLILGRPLGADTGDSNLLGQAALALGMAGSTPIAKNIASSLGIDDFQLDTEGSGLTTSVVATGYITEKLSLRYGVGVFEQANRLALRYDLTKRLYLEAVGGLASSLDFFYRIDF